MFTDHTSVSPGSRAKEEAAAPSSLPTRPRGVRRRGGAGVGGRRTPAGREVRPVGRAKPLPRAKRKKLLCVFWGLDFTEPPPTGVPRPARSLLLNVRAGGAGGNGLRETGNWLGCDSNPNRGLEFSLRREAVAPGPRPTVPNAADNARCPGRHRKTRTGPPPPVRSATAAAGERRAGASLVSP